jgi:hypothetical protein
MIHALISQTRGIAVFDDGDRIGVLDVCSPESPQYLADHIAAQTLSEASDLESLEVTDLPALRAHLRLRRRRQEALHAVLILLDGERSDELRAAAAKALEEALPEEILGWVEGVLMSAPLPELADPRRAKTWKTPFSRLFAELERDQQRIGVLQTAWRALPSDLFVHETRDQVRAKVVRQGVFRCLLRGKAPSPYSPFAGALASYASALDDIGSRSTFQQHRDDAASHGKRDADITAVHQLWEVSPWSSAWLAVEWPRLESTLAFDAASKWSNHFLTKKSLQRFPLERAPLDSLFNCWESVRHHSNLATSVDLIWDLAFSERRVPRGRLHFFETKSHLAESSYHQRRVLDLVNRGVLTSHYNDMPERKLRSLLLALFDVRDESGSDTAARQSDSSEATRWKIFAICAHQVLATRTPLDAGCLLRGQTDPDVKAVMPLVNAGLTSWIEPVKDAIAIYALDRVFQQDGFVLHFTPKIHYSATGKARHSAVLANYSNRRSYVFSGYLAWILKCLGERLSADLRSGLPRELCGWTSLNELGKGLGRSSDIADKGISALKRQTMGAGFASASVQQEGDQVRLNPELAASSVPTARRF